MRRAVEEIIETLDMARADAGVDDRFEADDPAVPHLEELARHVLSLLPDESVDLVLRDLSLSFGLPRSTASRSA